MIKISLPFIFNLHGQMEVLTRIPTDNTDHSLIWIDLVTAQVAIDQLVHGSLYAPYLRSSFQLAQDLLTQLKAQTENTTARTVTGWELFAIKNAYNQYKIAFLAELGSLNSFFVTQKGPFSRRLSYISCFGECFTALLFSRHRRRRAS